MGKRSSAIRNSGCGWTTSGPEAYPFAATNWSRGHLEKYCPGDLPSAAWYFRRHTLRDAATRLWNGTREVVRDFLSRAEACLARVFLASRPKEMASAARSSRSLPFCACGTVRSATLAVRQAVLSRLLEPGNLAVASFVLMLAMLYTSSTGGICQSARATGSWGVFGFRPFSSFVGWRRSTRHRGQKAPMRSTWACTLPFCSLLLQSACILWRFHQGGFLKTQN